MRFRFFACITTILVVALMAPGAAHATQRSPHPPAMSPQGVGRAARITINNASLFQCPETFCNQGVANVEGNMPPGGDDIGDVCYIPREEHPPPPEWGGTWHLVLDHYSNIVGFISDTFLQSRDPNGLTTQRCFNAGVGTHPVRDGQAIYQCPKTFCNSWHMNHIDDVAALCGIEYSSIPPARWIWIMVLNHYDNTVGFSYETLDFSPDPSQSINDC